MGHTNRDIPDNSYGSEVRFHIDNLVEMLMKEGMSRVDAEREARRRFGSPRRHDPRRARRGRSRFWDWMRMDLGFALRSLRRNPGFSAVVILTLGLGIGANTAIFSVFNGVVLRELPFERPQELVFVWEKSDLEGIERSETSAGIFRDWLERNQTFEDMTAWAWDEGIAVEEDGRAEMLNVLVAYPNFFEVLGASPQLGRTFGPDEATDGSRGNVAVISDRLWRERYGGTGDILGRSINVDGAPFEIVGVMPAGLAAPDTEIDVWVPAGFVSTLRWDRHRRNLTVIGRLGEGVSAGQAQADVSRIAAGLREGEFSDIYEGWDALIEPMQKGIVGNSTQMIVAAFLAVALVLLIACVNVANLLLARATSRSREMALRVAVGAGRGRLLRQLITESLVLSLGAGIAGILVAMALHSTLLGLEPGLIPRVEELGIDSAAMAFALGVAVVTGVVFGATPMLAGMLNLADALREGGDRASDSRAVQRLRSVLVVAQVGVTVVLLASAGLLFRSLNALNSVDPGFDHDRAVAARMYLDGNTYSSGELISGYYERLIREAASIPGVTSAGLTTALPMDPLAINYDLPLRFEGESREWESSNTAPQADFRVVSPGYFETLSIDIVAGRDLAESDVATSPFVMLVNEEFVRRFLEGEEAIGVRVETPSTDWHWFEIVGVVRDTRFYGPASEVKAEMYMTYKQVPRSVATLVVASDNPAGIVNPLRSVIRDLDRGQPPHSILPVSELVRDAVGAERFFAGVIGAFAAVALVLSTVGLYGVISFWVGRSKREIGVRMALGASRRDVVALVLSKTAVLVGGGLVLGVLGAVIAGDAIERTLFQVGARDPATLLGVVAILFATAITAAALPALRAARINPSTTLRSD